MFSQKYLHEIFLEKTKQGAKQMVELNLNTQIIADLTDFGEKILRKHYEKIQKKNPKIDAEVAIGSHFQFANKYKFTLWEFASIFGDAMYNGGPNIVDNNDIAIDEKDIHISDVLENQIKVSTRRQSLIFDVRSIEIDNAEDGSDYIEIKRDDEVPGVVVSTSKNMLKAFI